VTLVRELAVLSAGAIVAVWFAYPLAVALLAQWHRSIRPERRRPWSRGRRAERRRPWSTGVSSSDPTVSVVIAARDDPAVVRERIADCLRAPVDPMALEVVVGIDGGGAPIATGELSIAPNVTVVPGDPPGGKAATLNAAARVARGAVLLFADVHQRFERDAITRLVAAFDDARVGAASGRLELAPGARRSPIGRYWSYERWLRRCEADVHSCVGATGAIWAMRRALWAPLPPNLILDDVYAPMRVVLAGHRVAFVDDARAVDVRSVERASEYRRKVRTLTGNIQLCVWLPRLLMPLRNPIWPQFVFHKLLRLLTPYWLIAVLLWGAVSALQRTGAYPAVGVLMALALAVALLSPSARVVRIMRQTAVWGLMLQAAVVVAAMNGFRRRWDVWRA
jgi:cellulose synthase/poly-beta-1,6-N-acetylglucosamine synthase-like glycosyltransferase